MTPVFLKLWERVRMTQVGQSEGFNTEGPEQIGGTREVSRFLVVGRGGVGLSPWRLRMESCWSSLPPRCIEKPDWQFDWSWQKRVRWDRGWPAETWGCRGQAPA